jgi:hypothetical protein
MAIASLPGGSLPPAYDPEDPRTWGDPGRWSFGVLQNALRTIRELASTVPVDREGVMVYCSPRLNGVDGAIEKCVAGRTSTQVVVQTSEGWHHKWQNGVRIPLSDDVVASYREQRDEGPPVHLTQIGRWTQDVPPYLRTVVASLSQYLRCPADFAANPLPDWAAKPYVYDCARP